MYQFFTDKTVLVVDDYAEFRISVKGMVEKFGAQRIDVAKNGDEAVHAYVQTQHDIVLCDYNLGEGKNGQQVLEELHHREVFRYDTTFILVTAERTIAMVMGALEYKPDDYLTKPFTQSALRTRLIRVAQQKADLKPIYTAITGRHYERAIQACEKHIEGKGRYSQLCRQLIAECYLRLEQPEQSQAIYNAMLAERPTPTAVLGVAKCQFHLGDIDDCEKSLNSLLKIQPKSTEAMDLMAEIKHKQGKIEQEKHWLKQASQLSPLSIDRQRKLVEAAKATLDQELELRSLRHVSKLSQYSSKVNPDDASAYVQAILKKAKDESGLKRSRLLAEASSTIKNDQKRFKSEPRFQIQAELLQLQAKIMEAGEKQVRQLAEQINSHEAAALKLQDGLALQLLMENHRLVGNEKQAEEVSNKAVQAANLQKQQEARAAQTPENMLGIKAYKDGQVSEAILHFRKAITNFPDSVNISLNLIQALLKQMKSQSTNVEYLTESKGILERISYLPTHDPRFERLQQLKRHVETLEIQYERNRSAN